MLLQVVVCVHCLYFVCFLFVRRQGMAAIMPAMIIVGLAKTIPTLYTGLALFSFGKLLAPVSPFCYFIQKRSRTLALIHPLVRNVQCTLYHFVFFSFTGSGTVVPCLTTMISHHGKTGW